MRDLELDLPDVAGIAVYAPGMCFGPRAMHEYELVWMIEGDAQYRRGERTVEAPEGSLVMCRPGATDFFRWDPLRRTRHGFFHFHIRRLPRHWPAPDDWPLVRARPDGDLVRMLFRTFTTWSESRREVAHLAAEQLVAAFVFDALSVRDIPSAPLPEPVERAWSAIHRRLDDDPSAPIALADLAREAGVGAAHLCRLFTRATGRSPLRTAALARVDRAAALVTRGDEPFAAIAARLGYANQFHFSRAFRRAYGRSPTTARADAQLRGIPLLHGAALPPRVRGRDAVA
ncbi:MAG TPA: helix-turn-helix transcriptional regulator [Planctomycetota bacterium]|nr:helix-turn-helix transcriptional regulator [Planctomycetota bacterium]